MSNHHPLTGTPVLYLTSVSPASNHDGDEDKKLVPFKVKSESNDWITHLPDTVASFQGLSHSVSINDSDNFARQPDAKLKADAPRMSPTAAMKKPSTHKERVKDTEPKILKALFEQHLIGASNVLVSFVAAKAEYSPSTDAFKDALMNVKKEKLVEVDKVTKGLVLTERGVAKVNALDLEDVSPPKDNKEQQGFLLSIIEKKAKKAGGSKKNASGSKKKPAPKNSSASNKKKSASQKSLSLPPVEKTQKMFKLLCSGGSYTLKEIATAGVYSDKSDAPNDFLKFTTGLGMTEVLGEGKDKKWRLADIAFPYGRKKDPPAVAARGGDGAFNTVVATAPTEHALKRKAVPVVGENKKPKAPPPAPSKSFENQKAEAILKYVANWTALGMKVPVEYTSFLVGHKNTGSEGFKKPRRELEGKQLVETYKDDETKIKNFRLTENGVKMAKALHFYTSRPTSNKAMQKSIVAVLEELKEVVEGFPPKEKLNKMFGVLCSGDTTSGKAWAMVGDYGNPNSAGPKTLSKALEKLGLAIIHGSLKNGTIKLTNFAFPEGRNTINLVEEED